MKFLAFKENTVYNDARIGYINQQVGIINLSNKFVMKDEFYDTFDYERSGII